MTTITNECLPLYSLLDIVGRENKIDINTNLQEYSQFADSFMKQKEHFVQESRNFWKQKLSTQQSLLDKTFFSWVDIKELMENKKELPCDVSRNAFKNLIEHKTNLHIKSLASFDLLDNILPNFTEVTDYYRGAFAINQSRPVELYEAPRPILLLGDAGIGKTYYAKQLAKIFNTTYQFIDANSITATWVLAGHHKGWKGADAGLIFKLMAKSPTMSPILLIDEIDKLSTGKNYDPNSIFHQMFEKENSKQFYDEFVDVSFNASQIIYILTGNDKNCIAPTLLSRMTVFEIKNPNDEQMKKIIPTIYSDILAQSKMFKPNMEEGEINKLLTYTPRQVYQIISNNMYMQASEILKLGRKRKQSLIIKKLLPQSKSIGF